VPSERASIETVLLLLAELRKSFAKEERPLAELRQINSAKGVEGELEGEKEGEEEEEGDEEGDNMTAPIPIHSVESQSKLLLLF
jgi:hypothetical protein